MSAPPLDRILLACEKDCGVDRHFNNQIRMSRCFDLFCSCVCYSGLRRFVRRRSQVTLKKSRSEMMRTLKVVAETRSFVIRN